MGAVIRSSCAPKRQLKTPQKNCSNASFAKVAQMTDQFNQNRLAEATSPYLRQHMHNPVHWQPWEQAVFDEARDAMCQCCYRWVMPHAIGVMSWQHESFEDAELPR